MKHIDILAPETLSGAIPLPGALPPAPAVMRILDQFNREEIGHTIEVLVALLDICDAPGDPDEPDFRQIEAGDLRNRGDGMPGDPQDGEAVGDELDHSWPEWHSRGRKRVTAGGYEMAAIGGSFGVNSPSEDDEEGAWVELDECTGRHPLADTMITMGHEDAEEDDHPAQCTEDEISCGGQTWRWMDDQGPGCPLSDPGGQCDEDEINTATHVVLAERGPGCALADNGIGDSGGLQDAHGVDGDRWLTWGTDQTKLVMPG